MSAANPSKAGVVTRAQNSEQHPGMVDAKRKRRTKADMERQRALLKEEKRVRVQKEVESVERSAQLEEGMAAEDFAAKSAHPRNYPCALFYLP